MRSAKLGLLLAGLHACGCGGDEALPGPRARPDQVPATTQVPETTAAVLGFALGKLRPIADVPSFSITTTPVTVGQYRQCVEAGVCKRPSWNTTACLAAFGAVDGPTFERGAEDAPLTCAAPAQAIKYCGWIGGRLPHAAEWLVASRGKVPARFAWGNAAPTCDKQWRLAWSASGESCCGPDCSIPAAAAVGKHPQGASKAGLADVLSTRAELIGSGGAQFGLCSKFGCLVTGLVPGAIDSVIPLDSDLDGDDRGAILAELGRIAPAASFRCVVAERSAR